MSSNTVPENEPSGTTVGTLTTTDPDDTSGFTYSLIGGDTGSFQISGDELQTATTFDYETKSSYSVTVRTTDPSGGTYDEAFTINVLDVEDAYLSGLALSEGTLSPVFASGTTSYTSSVGHSVSEITVTPTLSDANASVTVQGSAVTSGTASAPIALSVGSNTITTEVTSESGSTTKTYEIVVDRAASSNADLSNLVLSDGTLSPVFDASTLSYSASVPASVSSITVTPTLADGDASVTVQGVAVTSGTASDPIALSEGVNSITTEVTAQDGTTTKTYTVDVTRESPDADGTLTASAGVTEPVPLGSTLDTVGEAVDVFDFTLADGGTSDGLSMTVSAITMNVSGTSTDAERDQITWRLNGPDASNVTGTYDAGAGAITFSGLSISVADGASEIYTVNAYYNDNTNLTEDHTYLLSVDGDTDVTINASGTQMGSTSPVDNGTGSPIEVSATQLAFTTQPGGSVSGSAMTTQPVVAAQDAFGNTDVDFAETITLTEASAGSLSGDVDIAAASGVATFTDVAYTATADQENFTLTANDEDGTGTDLSTVDANTVTSDVVATQLQFSTEPSPTTVARNLETSFATVPVVQAVDANGIVDTGYNTDITLAEVNGAGSAAMNGTGDLDGSASTVTLTPSSGAASFPDLAITYAPGGSGVETFNLQASSGGLTAATSTDLAANQWPTFDAGGSTTLDVNEDSDAASINSLLAVTDPDNGQTLTWAVASGPSKGSLGGFSTNEPSDGSSITPGGLTYTPNPDATGTDHFAIEISDELNTDVIKVEVTINARPTVTITSGESAPTNTSPFDVTATFSESVTDFASGDVTVGNGTVSSVSGSGDTYTVSITPSSDGTVTVDIPANGATDGGGAGNEAASTFSIEYDGTAPAAPIAPDLADASDTGSSNTDNVTHDTTPTLTGTAEANSMVQVTSSEAGLLGFTTADGSGTWSFTPGSALSEATHSVTVTATDEAGSESTPSPALSITIDTSAPNAPSAPDLASSSDTGDSSTDDITSDTTPTLTGTAEAHSIVEVTSDQDGFLGTTTADSNGDWIVTPGSALSEATHTVTVVATDAAGNASSVSSGLSVTIDVIAPAAPSAPDLLAGSDTGVSDTDDQTSDPTPTLSGTADSDVAIAITSDVDGSVGSTTADGAGQWTVTTATLTEAAHNLTVTAADAAGNTTTGSALSIVVDTTPPSLTSTSPADDATSVQHDDNLTLSFSEAIAVGTGTNTTVDIYRASDDGLHESVAITAATLSANTATIPLSNSFDPTESYYVHVGADALTDAVGNGFGGIQDQTTLNFSIANNDPTATADTYTVDEDGTLTVVAPGVLANDSDPEDQALQVATTPVSDPTDGTVTLQADGAFTYVPGQDFNGTDHFTYAIEDPSGATAEATVTISVTAVPDVAIVDGWEESSDRTDGYEYHPPTPVAGTHGNPVGRFHLAADEDGATLSGVVIANNAPGATGVAAVELWTSSDDAFDPASDAEVASASYSDQVAFTNLSTPIPADGQYVFVVIDLEDEMAGQFEPFIVSQDHLTIADGQVSFVNVNQTNSFSDLFLSMGATALPVELTQFEAVTHTEEIVLTWTTASETNNAGFYVEHLRDGAESTSATWHELGFIEGHGTTVEASAYRFEAKALGPGTHTFRLRQVDVDGSVAFSDEVTATVALDEAYRLVVYPTPIRSRATVDVAVQEAQHVRVELYDVLGRRVSTLHDGPLAGNEVTRLPLDAGRYRLASGMYLVRIVGERFAGTRRVTLVR